MKNTNDAFTVLSRICRGAFIAAFVTLLLAISVTGVRAQTYTLSVADSSLQVNLTGGLSNWTVGGANQLGQQSFYYTVGGLEYPINQISAPSTPQFSGLAFGGSILDTNLSVSYANTSLRLTTGYTLAVQGSGATLATTITLQNLSGASETLQFYQLSDFTLGGTSSGQAVQFLQTGFPYSVIQTGPGATLTGSLNGVGLGTTIPVGEMAGIGNLGLGNGNAAPNFGDTSLSASGTGVEYGYEFNLTLAANSGITISELQAVPEPSSIALFSFGLLALALLRRRTLALIKK
jgi:hypothetical protein